jgi:hypothetical protein
VTCYVLSLPDYLPTKGSIGVIGLVDIDCHGDGVRQAISYFRMRPNVLGKGSLLGRTSVVRLPVVRWHLRPASLAPWRKMPAPWCTIVDLELVHRRCSRAR